MCSNTRMCNAARAAMKACPSHDALDLAAHAFEAARAACNNVFIADYHLMETLLHHAEQESQRRQSAARKASPAGKGGPLPQPEESPHLRRARASIRALRQKLASGLTACDDPHCPRCKPGGRPIFAGAPGISHPANLASA